MPVTSIVLSSENEMVEGRPGESTPVGCTVRLEVDLFLTPSERDQLLNCGPTPVAVAEVAKLAGGWRSYSADEARGIAAGVIGEALVLLSTHLTKEDFVVTGTHLTSYVNLVWGLRLDPEDVINAYTSRQSLIIPELSGESISPAPGV